MRRMPGVEDAAWALAGSLGDREQILAVARAQLPVARRNPLRLCAAWLTWSAAFLLGRRSLSESAGPLDGLWTRVDLVATDTRVLVLDAGWDGTGPATCVGKIPRSEITTVSAPFVGDTRSRTVLIDRTSGPAMQLQIDRHTAGGFLAALA